MLLTVPGTSIVRQPYIVTSICQLQVVWHLVLPIIGCAIQPGSSILIVTMIHEHGWLRWREESRIRPASHMEERQNVAIFGLNLVVVPRIAQSTHQVRESLILRIFVACCLAG
jgi:hypothetical protein